jgi:L-lysine 2,3-aminomutase
VPNEEIVYYTGGMPVESSSPEMAEILRHVEETSSIKIVVISARWIVKGVPEGKLRATIQLLKSAGKTVVITNDIPQTPSSPDSC